ncbi:SDR family oxidoreductase [Candidatus Cyanaurora vandensis]|uniref:SDR family oxidoreductase n=1 Tax=Candidatus Cyanaurora vandensis TaxID=2714958 RepID=UPI00257F5CA9|nr:SDR family oxidoreductase [Candidatus Cyanaurora vandensis]
MGVWLITGTSTGFGRGLTERLLERGDQVIATARQVEQIQDFAERFGERVLTLPLDVTQSEDPERAVAAGLARFGRIDGLVNNAGYGYFATQEEGDLPKVEQMFQVNVFGLVRMTQAVLPVMRTQGRGLVVNLSSVGGRVAFAGGGFYNATKFAVEALSEALFYEVASFGIRVLVIEPGAYATDFGSRSAVRDGGKEDSPYQAVRASWGAAMSKVMPQRQDPADGITQMLTALDAGEPFARVAIGPDSVSAIGQRETLGDKAFMKMMAQRYGLTQMPE